jgi:hypothetical protein
MSQQIDTEQLKKQIKRAIALGRSKEDIVESLSGLDPAQSLNHEMAA